MAADEAEQAVRALARHLGVAIRPEHLAEAAAGWRLAQPHLERVMAAELGPEHEPAALFRP